MYLIITHIPVYTDGDHTYVSTEWKRSLILLKNSFEGKLGPITLLAPSMTVAEYTEKQQVLEPISEQIDGIKIISSLNLQGRASHYWLNQRCAWVDSVRKHVKLATLVHAGFDQLWKPIQLEGFVEGVRQKKPTVFVADTDVITQLNQLSQHSSLKIKIKNNLYSTGVTYAMRWAVGKADLSLLKGQELQKRYRYYAKNCKDFHDTSYLASEVISDKSLEMRLHNFLHRKSLRLVYCGRLEPRKGLINSLEIISNGLQKGLDIQFDLIGDGPQKSIIEQKAADLGLSKHVIFHGALPYNSFLLNKLTEYDALLFTPNAEDTPRMIFDAFSAGLPLIGYNIPYSNEIIKKSKAGLLWDRDDIQGIMQGLATLANNRKVIPELSINAKNEALKQSADVWYKKRAEWTLEAINKHKLTPLGK